MEKIKTAAAAVRSWVRNNSFHFIFVLVVVLRIAFLTATQTTTSVYDNEMHRSARTLARTGTLADPYGCQSGPTAHVAPGYPALLAVVYRHASQPDRWIEMLAILASALGWALLPWLAEGLGLERDAGLAAGLLGALFPYAPGMEARGAWEVPFVTCLLVLAAGWTARRQIPAAGVAWGAGFLFGPALLPVCVVMLAFWRRRAVVIVGIALAVVAPWIIRDYATFGRLYWIRSNLGLELEVSNNDGANPVACDNLFLTRSYESHPASRKNKCLALAKAGEADYMDGQMREAVNWIRNHPGDFTKLTLQRAWYFWNPPINSRPRRMLAVTIGLLGFIGAMIAGRTNQRAAGLFCGAFLAYPLLYYFVQVDPRYRSPITPVLYLAAVIPFQFVIRQRRRMRAGTHAVGTEVPSI
jgi:hypothetical protein